MDNEPVTWGYKDFNGDISDCICPEEHDRAEGDYTIPLYTHPVKELDEQFKKGFEAGKEEGWKAHKFHHPVKEFNDGGEPVKNATYWKRQYNLMATQNDNLKSGLYHANEQIKYLESHPVKELTDEEKWKLWGECPNGLVYDRVMMFADLVLRKAQEQ